MSLHIVILAAGKGKRMHSRLPKVLHTIAGKPMLQRVVELAKELNPEAVHIIIGHRGEEIKNKLNYLDVNWVTQKEQLGTGHAVMQALPHIPEDANILILSADVPLIQKQTLEKLIHTASQNNNKTPLTLLLAELQDPSGLGRIVRDTTGNILSIVEEKDANPAQKAIKEIYSGICLVSAKDLNSWLPQLKNQNAQGEYYLTDIICIAAGQKQEIQSIHAADSIEIQGVNNRLQLHLLERAWQKRCAEQLMLSGVTLADASRFDLRGNIQCGSDSFIDANCIFNGNVIIGENCKIGPNCILSDVTVADNCIIEANSVLESCFIGQNCQIGPFARIRPGTELAENCKIGNFVEMKKTRMDKGSKASHLTYLGDAVIGQAVNVGAGTITCNYDGVNKHITVIEDGAFIGSGSQLVAPVTIGKNATIGAGSTIRKNAPAEQLTLSEAKQKSISGWRRPEKKKQDKVEV